MSFERGSFQHDHDLFALARLEDEIYGFLPLFAFTLLDEPALMLHLRVNHHAAIAGGQSHWELLRDRARDAS